MSSLLQDRNPDVAPTAGQQRGRRKLPLRLAAAGIGLLVAVPLVDRALDLLPSWGNPLEQEVVDRSTPPLMLALEDLAEYHAATGTFQVVIDQERDTPYLPSVISGERTSFLATGTVDASVDFSDLADERVEVSADRRSVSIELPAPELGEARIDPDESRVLDTDRGLLERVGGMFEENPSSEGAFYSIAEQRLENAAAQSDLVVRAEDNTRDMLTALAGSMGFERVTVTFDPAPGGRG